ncbi:sugar kinase [Breznakiella homolactica]|uniref:Sugar kinase n=1 Tax=Breznakiella homolactica TaxID=2798577 RepID=A0A7T8B9S6_9SPIR|nr:sugar kinase [Breznakiella homolactica]QQO08616.1 sugar kinase [Breznakiella homolactica]
MGKLVTFGEVMARMEPQFPYRFAQAVPGTLNCTFAGAEANVAASYALLGGDASYATALPSGPLPDAFITQMRGLTVDISRIHITPKGRMGIFFLETGSCQRPSKVWYDRDYSSIAVTAPEEYDWETILKDAERLHISGITPAISEMAAQSSLAIVKAAAAKGIKVSVDLNFRKKLWKWRPGKSANELAREVVGEMLGYTDLVIGNEEDAHDVLGIQAGESDVNAGKLDIGRYPDVAGQIAARYPSVTKVAFTLRESISANHNNWGAMLWVKDSGKAHFAPLKDGQYEPYRITDITDRVGGGDSFAASLLFALQDPEFSGNTQDCLAFAVAASCLCHTIKGDFNYVNREEVVSLMKGDSTGRVKR